MYIIFNRLKSSFWSRTADGVTSCSLAAVRMQPDGVVKSKIRLQLTHIKPQIMQSWQTDCVGYVRIWRSCSRRQTDFAVLLIRKRKISMCPLHRIVYLRLFSATLLDYSRHSSQTRPLFWTGKRFLKWNNCQLHRALISTGVGKAWKWSRNKSLGARVNALMQAWHQVIWWVIFSTVFSFLVLLGIPSPIRNKVACVQGVVVKGKRNLSGRQQLSRRAPQSVRCPCTEGG